MQFQYVRKKFTLGSDAFEVAIMYNNNSIIFLYGYLKRNQLILAKSVNMFRRKSTSIQTKHSTDSEIFIEVYNFF